MSITRGGGDTVGVRAYRASDGRGSVGGAEQSAADVSGCADVIRERERLGEESERLAGERELLADEREASADAREAAADRRETTLSAWEAQLDERARALGEVAAGRRQRAYEKIDRAHGLLDASRERLERSAAVLHRATASDVREQLAVEQEVADSQTRQAQRDATGGNGPGPAGDRIGDAPESAKGPSGAPKSREGQTRP